MDNKTYVFEGTEVRKTGRIAEKTMPTMAGRTPRVLTLVEITPVAEFDWKKWVSPEQLYEVK